MTGQASNRPPAATSPRPGLRAWLAAIAGHIREAGPLKVALRALVIWALDSLALLVLMWLVPGFSATGWRVAVAAALVIGLLNALVRPLILALAVNLPLILFALVVLFLNAIVVLLAGAFVPGLTVESIWSALAVSFGLAALNTLLTSLLHINDDDSFYRNVVRRLQRDALPAAGLNRPGAVIVQIDGLAEPILRRALAEGRMPTLARWLESGSHRLTGWECDIPSMTSSGQSGILWGNNADIPAFRWFDKDLGRLLVSNHPRDARDMDRRQATAHGLLGQGGSSINNIFTGGADRSVITMATIVDADGKVAAAPRDFAGFFASPYALTRLLMAVVWEIAVEYWEAWRQRRRGELPRMHRGGIFPLQRAGTNVLLRDLTVWLVVSDMQMGRPVSYCDLLGYDEVAHHAGPFSIDALRTLRVIDDQLHALEKAAQAAPQPYQIVVVSDHGQSWGATFRQRYGLTLEDLVRGHGPDASAVQQTREAGEGAGYVGAALSQVAAAGGLAGGAVRRVTRRSGQDGTVQLGRDEDDKAAAAAAEVVVCASGNLGLISFTRIPGRLSLEALEAAQPGLIERLLAHEGIGWLLVNSETDGPLVLGKDGARNLATGLVDGVDPLARFSPHTAQFLKRLSTYPNVPDIVVNSTLYNAETGEVAAFEELIGCHGGAGGMQTQPFVLFPSDWTDEQPQLVGAESVHRFLSQFIRGLNTEQRR